MGRALAGAAYGVLAATDTALASAPSGWRRGRLVTKPLLMPVLAAGGAGRTTGTRRPGRRRTLAAQALSWSGDVALMRTSNTAFLTGLASFLAAHGAYVSALRSRSSSALLATPGRRRLFALGATVATGMGVAAGRQDPKLAVPVAGYGLTLAALVTAAAAVDRDRGRGPLLAGTSLFLLSDTILGVDSFVVEGRMPALEGAVMATYTAAQWLLAEGLMG